MKKGYAKPVIQVMNYSTSNFLAASGFNASAQQNPGISSSRSARHFCQWDDDDNSENEW